MARHIFNTKTGESRTDHSEVICEVVIRDADRNWKTAVFTPPLTQAELDELERVIRNLPAGFTYVPKN
jgi:hypothetical protein